MEGHKRGGRKVVFLFVCSWLWYDVEETPAIPSHPAPAPAPCPPLLVNLLFTPVGVIFNGLLQTTKGKI